MTAANTMTSEKLKYSKLLSSLFCFTSIIVLSILCLLNNLSFDIYSMFMLIKIVAPGSFCFWLFGVIIGKILDSCANIPSSGQKEVKLTDDNSAYQIPSMFSDGSELEIESELGEV